ncbi:Fc.00g054840.m01.CDS01 [Cosmosporella sp. VM-42]
MRSYSGCVTCRNRKLKCDEGKPVCGNCAKRSRDCLFAERVVFRNVEVQSLSEGKKKYGRDQVWLNIPKDLTFIHVEDPYTFSSPAPECHQPQELVSPAASCRDHYTTPWDIPHHQSSFEGEDSQLEIPSHPTLGEQDDRSSNLGGLECSVRENVLALRLLQHFKEGPGQWMDVFDTNAYFSHKVPLMAATKPLLKSAACALAAKHLRHVQRKQLSNNSNLASLSPGLSLPLDDNTDWGFLSAKYYYQAISHLKSAVKLRRFTMPGPDKEELFAAIAILCIYDLMEYPGIAWRAHLSALPLFIPAPDSDSSSSSSSTTPRAPISGPVFWNLARQDLLCAFVSETNTRLDVDDIQLWKNAGLATDGNGLLASVVESGETEEIHTTAEVVEDTRSNEIHWLLGKIINFVTSGDALYPENYALFGGQRPLIGVTQEQLLERWALLVAELLKWRQSLPASFIPSARTSVMGCEGSPVAMSRFEQIWYDAPICAGAMQSYHMAAILLLVNQPQESTAIRNTVSARLHSYRRGEREALLHAREICGIALTTPPSPVRVHSVQPLYVAGQVFEKWEDVEVVLHLLEEIEEDLGWTTSCYVARLKTLQEGWQCEKPNWMFL